MRQKFENQFLTYVEGHVDSKTLFYLQQETFLAVPVALSSFWTVSACYNSYRKQFYRHSTHPHQYHVEFMNDNEKWQKESRQLLSTHKASDKVGMSALTEPAIV